MQEDLRKLLTSHSKAVSSVGDRLLAQDRPSLDADLAHLVTLLASKLTVLGPLTEKAALSAFTNATIAQLDAELAVLESQAQRRRFAREIGEVLEHLIGQAVIQVVHSQHSITEELREAITCSFGGLRDDLISYRVAIANGLSETQCIDITEQHVADNATGAQVKSRSSQRTFVSISNQTIGTGSAGIIVNVGEVAKYVQPIGNIKPCRGPFIGRYAAMQQLHQIFKDKNLPHVHIVTGQPGVGKTELVLRYAHEHASEYPGGTFFVRLDSDAPPPALAQIGRDYLDLQFPIEIDLASQCEMSLAALGRDALTLLIYDNVNEQRALERWQPMLGQRCHILATTILNYWPDWDSTSTLDLLSQQASEELIENLIPNREITHRYGAELIARAGGLPVALCADAKALAQKVRHGRIRSPSRELATDTTQSFINAWEQLDQGGQFVLKVAAFFDPARIPESGVIDLVTKRGSLSRTQCEEAIDICIDRYLLQQGLRMHSLLAEFVRSQQEPHIPGPLLATHAEKFVERAKSYIEQPGDDNLAESLLSYPITITAWSTAPRILTENTHTVGESLIELGRFIEAREWCEQAVETARQGDGHGCVDYQSLGENLHQLGLCYSQTGEYKQAREWFEQAVEAARRGDIDGCVDYQSLGKSLHQVGLCYEEVGEYEQARAWYEEAVEATRRGDIDGRVAYQSLGNSLHQVGLCYSRMRASKEARAWYEKAVEMAKRGDAYGRVDYQSLCHSLHQLGWCYEEMKEYKEARVWFEKAVEAARLGDIYGRVDHDCLGNSLHCVGWCYEETKEYKEARVWYEQAVDAARRGDIHGRVDHDGLGRSLHQVGWCYLQSGEYQQAREWFERAVQKKREGDIHGRVDHESLGKSLHQVGWCYYRTGEYQQAREWFEKAVEEKREGDIHGRVNHQTLGQSLHAVGWCSEEAGEGIQAREWYEKAADEKRKGDIHGRVDHESLAISEAALKALDSRERSEGGVD